MRKLEHVLPSAIEGDEVLRAVRALRVLRRWPEVVGDFLAEKSQPDRYARGTVWVAVQGSSWAQELRMMKERIVERLREISGEPTLFHDVRFGVRPLKKEEPEPEAPEPKPEKDDLSGMTIREIAERRLAQWPKDDPGV